MEHRGVGCGSLLPFKAAGDRDMLTIGQAVSDRTPEDGGDPKGARSETGKRVVAGVEDLCSGGTRRGAEVPRCRKSGRGRARSGSAKEE